MQSLIKATPALCLIGGCWSQSSPPAPPPEPPPRTLAELLDACEYDPVNRQDRAACWEAGRILVNEGRQAEAVQPLFFACTEIADACIDLGLVHLRGEGVPRDGREALRVFASASARSGRAQGWLSLVDLELDLPTRRQRLSLEWGMHDGCADSDVGWPCYNYGILLSCGYFGEIDFRHAHSAFHRGCSLGDGRACDLAGKLNEGPISVPCTLVGPDPAVGPVPLELRVAPPDPSVPLPADFKRFERPPFDMALPAGW